MALLHIRVVDALISARLDPSRGRPRVGWVLRKPKVAFICRSMDESIALILKKNLHSSWNASVSVEWQDNGDVTTWAGEFEGRNSGCQCAP